MITLKDNIVVQYHWQQKSVYSADLRVEFRIWPKENSKVKAIPHWVAVGDSWILINIIHE